MLSGIEFMDMLHMMIGNVQGGAIVLVIFGILGGARTQWWYPVLLGAVYCPLYYGVFSAVIRRMNVETPGRESAEQTPPEQETQSADERSQTIINGLGGRQNIADVDCCFTRLRVRVRVRVRDMQQVVDRTLMLTGGQRQRCTGYLWLAGGENRPRR